MSRAKSVPAELWLNLNNTNFGTTSKWEPKPLESLSSTFELGKTKHDRNRTNENGAQRTNMLADCTVDNPNLHTTIAVVL